MYFVIPSFVIPFFHFPRIVNSGAFVIPAEAEIQIDNNAYS
jgi:hypothetical protein